jgi:hypothetical protein
VLGLIRRNAPAATSQFLTFPFKLRIEHLPKTISKAYNFSPEASCTESTGQKPFDQRVMRYFSSSWILSDNPEQSTLSINANMVLDMPEGAALVKGADWTRKTVP